MVHCYFKQGAVEQVTFKETVAVPNMLVVGAKTECMATEWQKRMAAEKLVEAVVAAPPRSPAALWSCLSLSLRQKYIKQGLLHSGIEAADAADEEEAEEAGRAYCMRLHDWERRGVFVSTEVESFETKVIVMRSTFRLQVRPRLSHTRTPAHTHARTHAHTQALQLPRPLSGLSGSG